MKKPAIIILHGWGLSAQRFMPLARELTGDGWRVLVPDLPGFGKSATPVRPFALSDYCEFLHTFIHKKKLGRVVLLGHSFGGRVSLRYANMYPGDVSGLILTGTPGVTPVPRRRLMLFIVVAKIGKAILSIWPLSILQNKIRLWYYYLVGAREFYRASGVMRDTFKLIVKEELTEFMRGIRVPCLLVWGALDRITPVWIAEKMHDLIEKSELVIIADRDHGVPFKDSRLFVSRITPFLHTL